MADPGLELKSLDWAPRPQDTVSSLCVHSLVGRREWVSSGGTLPMSGEGGRAFVKGAGPNGWVVSLIFSGSPVCTRPVPLFPELHQTSISRQAGTVCFLHSWFGTRPIITILKIKIMRRKKRLPLLIWCPFHARRAVHLIPLAG